MKNEGGPGRVARGADVICAYSLSLWTGIYLYGYDNGKFDAVSWSINLDL